MLLQRLKHDRSDVLGCDENSVILTHGVNEINLGGEYTICGRAIPDSNLDMEGWEAYGKAFRGGVRLCECKDCLRIIRYYKSLR